MEFEQFERISRVSIHPYFTHSRERSEIFFQINTKRVFPIIVSSLFNVLKNFLRSSYCENIFFSRIYKKSLHSWKNFHFHVVQIYSDGVCT